MARKYSNLQKGVMTLLRASLKYCHSLEDVTHLDYVRVQRNLLSYM